MKFDIALFTDKGTRTINEDYVVYKEEQDSLLLVVADGLGGHDKGEVASRHVAEYIRENFDFSAQVDIEIGRVIRAAQESLLQLQRDEKSENAMKTTVVVLVANEKEIWLGHVGDSRGYIFKRFGKYLRTIDHSVPQMLALAGEIKEEEIRYHIERSSLLRVLGSKWEKDAVELSENIPLKKATGFLLCTDGFWELIEEKDMEKLLKKNETAKDWLDAMVNVVRVNGKGKEMDNYTACAVILQKEHRVL